MREALGSLTLRGRSFLAGGITALACGIALGQPPLVMMGTLALGLPLLAAFAVSHARHDLVLQRTVSPSLVEPGRPATVTLDLTNESRAPTGTLLLEEHVGYALGARPRFVVSGAGRGWRQTLTYQVRADVRGRHDVGPMTMRIIDPFGLVEVGRAFRTHHSITVVPRSIPLTPARHIGGRTGSGDQLTRSFSSGSPEDVSVRDYRVGDDLRRVHWRSSARSETLMVRREEQPWQARTTVLLDNRSLAHRGAGAASTLEDAVAVAASVATHLVGQGHDVRLVTAAGPHTCGVQHHQRIPEANLGTLLEALAGVELDDRTCVDTSWAREPGQGEQVVAVLGSGLVDDHQFLDRARRHSSAPIALVLDVSSVAGTHLGQTTVSARDRLTLLSARGWRVGLVPGDESLERTLDRVWREVTR